MDNVTINITEIINDVTIDIAEVINDVTIEISQIGTMGPIGPKGNIEFIVLGGNVSSGNVVYILNGLGYRYNPNDTSLQNKIFGIAKQAGTTGQTIEVYVSGVAEVIGWGLVIDSVYFAGINGTITTNPSANLYEMIGTSITTNKLLINKLSTKIN